MAAPALVAGLMGATSKSTSSGSQGFFYLLIIIAIAFYFFILRPQQRKAKALREQQNTFDVGDEVLTAGGLVGEVIDIDGDRVTLETSMGASFVVLRQYVLRSLEPPGPDADDDTDDEGDHDEADADVHDESDHDADEGNDPVDLDGQSDGRRDGRSRGSRGSGGKARRTGTDDRDDSGGEGPSTI